MRHPAFFVIFSLLLSVWTTAQDSKIGYFTTTYKVAIQGYDLVAYFKENKAVRGTDLFGARYDNTNFFFSSAENRDAFLQDPQRYLPQFGGWCAYGMGVREETHGYPPGKYNVNPEAFKIIDGKLYLFFDGPFKDQRFNALEEWNKDEENLKKHAEAHWQEINKVEPDP